jgi:hypothetical protein
LGAGSGVVDVGNQEALDAFAYAIDRIRSGRAAGAAVAEAGRGLQIDVAQGVWIFAGDCTLNQVVGAWMN